MFDELDSDNDKQLELLEIAPFFQYSLGEFSLSDVLSCISHLFLPHSDLLFNIELSPRQCECLFFLVDSNHATEVGMGEFITFISVIKQMEEKQSLDATYASRVFSGTRSNSINVSPRVRMASKWDAAMDRVDQDTLDEGDASSSFLIHSILIYFSF